MEASFEFADLASDRDWTNLQEDIDPEGGSRIIAQVLQTFRDCGARQFLEESTYIDRDFSASYSAFYSTLFRPRPKFCRRIHFFDADMSEVLEAESKLMLADGLEAGNGSYMGHVVVRPLAHAPVGSAIVSSRHFEAPEIRIDVRSEFKVHLLGAELTVTGIPVTEQDRRTGACAQSAIWTTGRHLQNRYAMPWYSVADINEAALKLADSTVSRSLPAGSEYLTDDGMVRALRAMGEHPIVYSPDADGQWVEHPRRTIARYLDSGIPVIVGMRRGEGIGHAVVAVGVSLANARSRTPKGGATAGDRIDRILVNDDQAGVYVPLPVGRPVRSPNAPDAADEDGAYTLDDASFLIVPLPNKVYMKADTAETLARDKIAFVKRNRARYLAETASEMSVDDWHVDDAFYASPPSDLVARTYLTLGWKYKQRLMRNLVAEQVKDDVTSMQLPRYVWVTEFSLPADVAPLDPCRQTVRGHVLIDATGSSHEDAVLLTHIPGIVLTQVFDPAGPPLETTTRLHVLTSDATYHPKIRGQRDFSICVPPGAT